MAFDPRKHPHRRWNPLTGAWVLVSPHRTQRPWQGKVESAAEEDRPAHDPSCYLCPGNARAGGNVNPPYAGTFVFDNDFPALTPDASDAADAPADARAARLLRVEPEPGRCRVVCFSPRHDLTLPRLTVPEIRSVVDVWADETTSLGALPCVNHVQVFENKGELMGCSNPHPHGQIWAEARVPEEPAKEAARQAEYRAAHGACLLCDVSAIEEADPSRIVRANDHFAAFVPFWAVWPFETMIVARRHVASIPDLTGDERDGLADLLKRLLTRYDNLFETSFPYSMGFHQAPTDGAAHPAWHLHAHVYPPLLRSAAVRKFMVGYEMLGNPQRDLTPEDAAARLRELSEIHYLER